MYLNRPSLKKTREFFFWSVSLFLNNNGFPSGVCLPEITNVVQAKVSVADMIRIHPMHKNKIDFVVDFDVIFLWLYS